MPASEKSDPARARERMQTKRDEPDRDGAEQNPPERLLEQEDEGTPESMDLRRIAEETALEDEPSDKGERDSSRDHAQPSEGVDDLLLRLFHLHAFHVFLDDGTVSVDELAKADADGDDADADRRELAGGKGEDPGDRGLRPVVMGGGAA